MTPREMAKAVMLVTAFCLMPKGRAYLWSIPTWGVYTGDGFRLARHVLDCYPTIDQLAIPPQIFITGPDNLLLAEHGEEIKASHLSQWLIDQGVPSDAIISDDDPTSQYTHGQAKRLIQAALEYNWHRVALFASGHHMLRAWLTTIAQLNKMGVSPERLLVVPEPGYLLNFDRKNPELKGQPTAWELFTQEAIPRIDKYQDKEPPDVATWDMAMDYLHIHGLDNV